MRQLNYGQHPRGAFLLGSWPKYSRVGTEVPIPAQTLYGGVGEVWVDEEFDEHIRANLIRKRILNEDREIMEIVAIIVKSGIL